MSEETDVTVANENGASNDSIQTVLAAANEDVLKRLASFAQGSQVQSIFARNLHLANWFEAIALTAKSEMNRRNGKEIKVEDPDELLRRRAGELTDIEIEAVAMGFGMLLAKRGQDLGDAFQQLLEAAYEPVRQEYLRRRPIDIAVDDSSGSDG